MFPDLSYLLHGLFGTQPDNFLRFVQTFGLFLVFAFLTAAFLLKEELRRRARIGQLTGEAVARKPGGRVTVWDYVFNGLLGFFLGFKLPYIATHFDAFRADPGSVILSSGGYWLPGVLLAAVFVAYFVWLARKEAPLDTTKLYTVMPHERVGPITMMAAIGGLLGAKLFAIIEYLPQFFADPIGVLFSGGGLAIYGGLIGGAVAVGWYAWRHSIRILPLADAVAPGLIFAYAVGRLGCQLSGDGDWGIVAAPQPDWWFLPDWMWSFTYPHNVLDRGVPIEGCTFNHCRELAEAVYPTPIYEIAMAVTIGLVLWSLRKRLTPYPGALFCLYLFLNGVERFFIEFIRVNDQYDVFGFELSQAQLIAIGFMVVGVIGGAVVYRRGKEARPQVPG